MARILDLQKLETTLDIDATVAMSTSSFAVCACSTHSILHCTPPDEFLAV